VEGDLQESVGFHSLQRRRDGVSGVEKDLTCHRGRAEHTDTADIRSGQGIEETRLASSRRTKDDDYQGGGQVLMAGDDVSLEVSS
jgi:hypothetical protein